jgi:hypothetical protein
MKGLNFASPPTEPKTSQRHFVPQSGQVLLITDSPASSSQFLLHALLQSQLKRETDTSNDARACILVSVDHDLSHINGIAARSVSPLALLASTTLVIVAEFELVQLPPHPISCFRRCAVAGISPARRSRSPSRASCHPGRHRLSIITRITQAALRHHSASVSRNYTTRYRATSDPRGFVHPRMDRHLVNRAHSLRPSHTSARSPRKYTLANHTVNPH